MWSHEQQHIHDSVRLCHTYLAPERCSSVASIVGWRRRKKQQKQQQQHSLFTDYIDDPVGQPMEKYVIHL